MLLFTAAELGGLLSMKIEEIKDYISSIGDLLYVQLTTNYPSLTNEKLQRYGNWSDSKQI